MQLTSRILASIFGLLPFFNQTGSLYFAYWPRQSRAPAFTALGLLLKHNVSSITFHRHFLTTRLHGQFAAIATGPRHNLPSLFWNIIADNEASIQSIKTQFACLVAAYRSSALTKPLLTLIQVVPMLSQSKMTHSIS